MLMCITLWRYRFTAHSQADIKRIPDTCCVIVNCLLADFCNCVNGQKYTQLMTIRLIKADYLWPVQIEQKHHWAVFNYSKPFCV